MWWAFFCSPPLGSGSATVTKRYYLLSALLMAWSDCEWFHSISTDELTARRSFLTLRTSGWNSQRWPNIGLLWNLEWKSWLNWQKGWVLRGALDSGCSAGAVLGWNERLQFQRVNSHMCACIAFEHMKSKFFGCRNCSGDLRLMKEAAED